MYKQVGSVACNRTCWVSALHACSKPSPWPSWNLGASAKLQCRLLTMYAATL